MPETKPISVAEIKINGGTQPRSEIDESVVSEYAEAMQGGAQFPPVVVFFDGAAHWLADGFHRTHAARRAKMDEISAEIHDGTKRDAILYSVGANYDHGLRRTPADKRKAVETLLTNPDVMNDPKTGEPWSDNKIAKLCKIDHKTAAKYRSDHNSSLGNSQVSATRTYTNKHGTTSTMDTSKIGKKKQSAHVTANGIERKPLEERAKEIDALAQEGHRSDQIADKLGIGVHQVRKVANKHGITLPDESIKRSHRVNASRVIGETVNGLEGYAMGLKSLVGEIGGIDKQDAERWHESIGESVKQFNALKRKLKEIINE